ncbi:MAG: SprT family zinc-dependent metalloprotease [Balneolaceae bacterium]|nr:SprT family zinc-dependent metalloprotease [Balneolaceae bacterium]
MSRSTFQIKVAGFTVEVVRKNIKNVYLRVCPPDGQVCISTPKEVPAESLQKFIISKQDWIRRKKQKVQSQIREPDLQYVSGESHYVQGRKYLLKVVEENKPQRVAIGNNDLLLLYIRPGRDETKRERVMREWYRDLLKNQIPDLISKWEQALGVSVDDWSVKKMKTRWGTCNTKARRIWLNLELAKRHRYLLDYVVLHEMVHLKERLHNDRFRAYLNTHMPDWREREEELKKRIS